MKTSPFLFPMEISLPTSSFISQISYMLVPRTRLLDLVSCSRYLPSLDTSFLPWPWTQCQVSDALWGISMKMNTCVTPEHIHPGVLDIVLFPGPQFAWESLVVAFAVLKMSWVHLALAHWATPPPVSVIMKWWQAWSQLLSPCLGFPRKNLYSQWFTSWI